ncbi:MAG TPA: efflux RND transporter periplasmic adaptor subunit [Candidatus Sulfotelmatobacter sp.]|jgi:membrane fusion protein (multidrug efflux system)|nr:efflux RND transporter periplasmic adaptor subunit [Candidatus Sulfotelmatobacter sp.]
MKRQVPVVVGVVIAIVLVLAIAGVLAGIKIWQVKSMIAFYKGFPPPSATISTALVQEEQWHDSLSAVGSINAEQGVIVAPEIAGMVTEIDFESGANVNKGDLLVKLDTSSEDAQLRAAQAQTDLARVSAERTRKLRADSTSSQSELDQAEANLKQAQANADAIQAVIDKKTIRAPFTGQLGIRQINLGEQIASGKGIVSLQALTPVFADFSLPQQDLEKLTNGLGVQVTSDTFPGKNFEGTITAINPDLDAVTRSVRVRAKFENTDKQLRPGMFVRVNVALPDDQKVLVVPATALVSAAYGDSVFVVVTAAQAGITNLPATSLVAQQKFIRAGRAQGDFVSVESGLSVGDKIVTAGAFKLRTGIGVVENNEVAPKISTSPNPPNS